MLRRLFCKHEFELIQNVEKFLFETDEIPYEIVKIYMCRKCGKVIKIKCL